MSFPAHVRIRSIQLRTAVIGVPFATAVTLSVVAAVNRGSLVSVNSRLRLATVWLIHLTGIRRTKSQHGLSSISLADPSFRWTVSHAVRWKLFFLARPIRVSFARTAIPTLASIEFASIFSRLPLLMRAVTRCR